MRPPRVKPAPRRGAGFTLVEVLVALFILAILAGMAFRGVDALSRAKEGALTATNRTLKLNTGMSQFSYDMSQLVDSHTLEQPITFDGKTLRFTRSAPGGVQLVVWTLQDRRWQRWASAPRTRFAELQEAFMQTQQWDTVRGNAVTILEDVTDFQVYAYNAGWTNLQSTQTGGGNNPGGAPPNGNTNNNAATYTGIRIVLKVPEGEISREKELPQLPS